MQSNWPTFQLGELQSGTTYKVNVRCENKHGRSDPLYLLVETLNEPIKQIAETKVKEQNVPHMLLANRKGGCLVDGWNVALVLMVVRCF